MSGNKRVAAALTVAILSGVACIVMLIEPQWFELLFDESPDGGDGGLEAIIAVAVSLVACVLFALLARREWRRGRRDAVASPAIVKDRA